jgi:hypothetical protein
LDAAKTESVKIKFLHGKNSGRKQLHFIDLTMHVTQEDENKKIRNVRKTGTGRKTAETSLNERSEMEKHGIANKT